MKALNLEYKTYIFR